MLSAGLTLARKFIASHEFNVWGLVFLSWFAMYRLFVVGESMMHPPRA